MTDISRRFLSRERIAQIANEVLGNLLPGQAEQDLYEQSAVQRYAVGSRRVVDNGGLTRIFYYAHIHAGITAGLGRGRVMMSSDDGTERGAFLGAQTAGAKTVTWTAVAAIAANQFKNGFVLLQGGFVREIKSHPAAAAPGAEITLTLYDPLPETIGAGRYGILLENPYANVYNSGSAGVHPNAFGPVMGVTGFDVTPDYYTWLQAWGPCGVIATPATLGDAANEMELSHGVNPGDEVGIAGGHGYQVIGYSMVANAINWDNENFMIVDLRIRR